MRGRLGQPGSTDGLVAGVGGSPSLERIAGQVDRAALGRPLAEVHTAPASRPSCGPLVLLRRLLLEQRHGLSDPEAEAAIADRPSSRRIVGLALADPVPDRSTLSRFRSGPR